MNNKNEAYFNRVRNILENYAISLSPNVGA